MTPKGWMLAQGSAITLLRTFTLCVYCREVSLTFYFSYYIPSIWVHNMDLENKLVSDAEDATLSAHIPSPNVRSDVTESLKRD